LKRSVTSRPAERRIISRPPGWESRNSVTSKTSPSRMTQVDAAVLCAATSRHVYSPGFELAEEASEAVESVADASAAGGGAGERVRARGGGGVSDRATGAQRPREVIGPQSEECGA
jgi:hypothetical protein